MARVFFIFLTTLFLLFISLANTAHAVVRAYVANGNGSGVNVIDTASDTVIATIAVGVSPQYMAITPDQTKVYVANSGSGTVSVINTGNNTVIATIPAGSDPFVVAITPDGTKAYVVNFTSSNVTVINTATNTVIATVSGGVGTNPYFIAITPDGIKAYLTNAGTANVSVINTASDIITTTVTVGLGPTSVSITPDGTKAYVTNSGSNTVSVIRIATDTVIATPAVGINPFLPPGITPDGTKVYVTNTSDTRVSVIDTTSNAVIATINVGSAPQHVAITPDSAKAYVANNVSNNVSIINTLSNTVIVTLGVAAGPFPVAVIPDGTKVYEGNIDGNTVNVIDTTSNDILATIAVASPVSIVFFVGPNLNISKTGEPNPVVAGADLTYTLSYSNTGLGSATGVIISDMIPVDTTFVSASPPAIVTSGVSTWNIGTVAGGATGSVQLVVNVDNTVADGATIDNQTYSIESNETGTVVGDPVSTTVISVRPPVSLTGKRVENRFLTQTDWINVITWSAPVGGLPPVAYKIYRNAALTDLAGVVSANGALIFEDHNRRKNKTYTYYIVSIDQSGVASGASSLTIVPD